MSKLVYLNKTTIRAIDISRRFWKPWKYKICVLFKKKLFDRNEYYEVGSYDSYEEAEDAIMEALQ